MEYNFIEVEKKWRDYWANNKTFQAKNVSDKPKYYVLDMFPYPSGAGLHVGHPLGYIASDIISRYKRLKGFNVLHPMGYDAFGLPAEQYAIQTGQHPAITTEQNINRYREQLDNIGFSFDWDREVRTSNPDFYKWTQWIFIKLFHSWYNKDADKAEDIKSLISEFEKNGNKNVNAASDEVSIFSSDDWKAMNEKEQQTMLLNYRLAFLSDTMVNWCPQLGTVLANEEVKDGFSERGGYPVVRKLMKQWSLRISAYADRLLNDLKDIDWSPSIKEIQENWIGRSEGSSLRFKILSLTPNPSPKERGTAPGYQTARKDMWVRLKEHARENRQTQTKAEEILWDKLRNHKTGYKIRRQHPIDQFIADFICLDKKLIIEVDGGIHLDQVEYDEGRTFMLEDIGYRVIRFTNDEVIEKTDWVIEEITKELSKELDSPKSSGSPLLGRGVGGEAIIEIFTTRPDTIFGATFITLAPEHELVDKITTADCKKAVDEYVQYSKSRSERDRMADVKKITGQFTGAYAIHPFTNEKIQIWVGDYVLANYGTGAVMAVPAHDTRDYAFAKYFQLPIVEVVSGGDISKEAYDAKEGKLVNSDFLNGLDVKDAIKKIIEKIEEQGLGKGKVNYRLRDAIFSRQRYWGEPFPIYYKDGIPYTLDEKDLPLELPEVDAYLPTESGEPPLARAKNWVTKDGYPLETNTMPGWAGSSWYYLRYMDAHNKDAFVSKDAVNYWQDVDLYIGGAEHATGHLLYVRFWTKFLYDLGLIPHKEPAKKLINQGMIQGVSTELNQYTAFEINKNNNPISDSVNKIISSCNQNRIIEIKNKRYHWDLKQGYYVPVKYSDSKGRLYKSEFTTLMNEPRFINTFGVIDLDNEVKWEKDGNNIDYLEVQLIVEKMSKSKLNEISPDDIITKYGADCLRLYEMFLGPLELPKPWNTNGIEGVSKFIRKLWRLYHDVAHKFAVSDDAPSAAELKILHKTIKKTEEDMERFSFNTSVSSFMICVNELTDLKCNKRAILEPLAIIIAPYAPFVAEELWSLLGHQESIAYASFPQWKEEFIIDQSFDYPISINGKTRVKISLPLNLTKEEITKEVLSKEEVLKLLDGKSPKNIIVVPNRIVNIVV